MMDFDDDAQVKALIGATATHTQVLYRLAQALFLVQLRQAPDPQKMIEQLRDFCLDDNLPPEGFRNAMEQFLASIEAASHQNPSDIA